MHHFLHTAILFLIVLGLMVLIHELGHFAVAKWCGVRVESFSIGMGPRLFGVRAGGTDYRVSLLPIGGYVKMAGDVPGEAPSGDPGEFNAHPRWQRMAIAFAGPIANFILCFVLLFLVAHFHHEVETYLDSVAVVDYVPLNSPAAKLGIAPGDTITGFAKDKNPSWQDIFNDCVNFYADQDVPVSFTHNGQAGSGTLHCPTAPKSLEPDASALTAIGLVPRLQSDPLSVYSVADNTPAQRAGLKAGDQILRVDDFEPHSADPGLITYLKDRNGAPAVLTVLRDGKVLTLNSVPERLAGGRGDVGYRLGFSNRPVPTRIVHLPFAKAVRQSIHDNLDDSKLLAKVLQGMFARRVSVKNLSGPVGIAQQISLAAEYGKWTLVRLMSSISLQLGILNLLPIPILDGGMILFLLIESFLRRDLNQQVKERIYQVAFVCLMVFAVFVFYNDISRMHS